MKHEIDCNVIVDLMPLYNEGICSEESRKLVEEHLKSCKKCRQLYEIKPVPDFEVLTEPSETETFRKVNKKLRQNRYVKAISAMCVLLVIFGVWNLSWYFISYRPYQKLLNVAQPFEKIFEDENIYSYDDGIYIYDVHMPNYLDFSSGFVSVYPDDRIVTDGKGTVISFKDEYALLFIWLKKGGTKYGVDIITGNHGNQFYIDKEMQTYNKTLEKYSDEVNELMDAVQNLWGDRL